MKRWLLPASALVLVVTACGAGAKPAPRVTEVRARVPSVHVIATRRKCAATRSAHRLLREFVPPPGARPTRQPREHGGVLRGSGWSPIGEVVGVHRFWRVHKSLSAVGTYVRTLRIRGLARQGAIHGTLAPHYLSWSFSGPPGDERRSLDVTAVAFPGRTVIRVDAQVVWIYPRSPGERVPPATREIVVRAPHVSLTVTDPAEIARIVRWFDALPISPPGVALPCPLMRFLAPAKVSFRTAHGGRLAEAGVPRSPPASIWGPIRFMIGGRSQKPLIDRSRGRSFVRRLQDLLHVQLLETHR
jgi:hypothetical protein